MLGPSRRRRRARRRAHRPGENGRRSDVVHGDERSGHRLPAQALRRALPVPQADRAPGHGGKGAHAHPHRGARQPLLLGHRIVQPARHGRARSRGPARRLSVSGSSDRVCARRGRSAGPLGGHLRAPIRDRLQHAPSEAERSAEKLERPPCSALDGQDRARTAATPRAARRSRRSSARSSTCGSCRAALTSSSGMRPTPSPNSPENFWRNAKLRDRGYLLHHCLSHGTPSLFPSIRTPGQFVRKNVASSQEVICEQ